MKYINNPILKGFNPDPSIVRVGDDYYIANSTFEFYPGVAIHHSKDLVNWRLLGYALNKKSQLNMIGEPSSGGVWAPCLTYDNGTFYLVYSDVKNYCGIWKDVHNYVVTTNDILKEWSDPIYLNSSGFDPSMFHDDDGTKWVLNMIWEHRNGKHRFGGIILQQYSETEKKLVGEVYNILERSSDGMRCTEGPHLYKRNGYYYLLVAEGGTSYEHSVQIFRSKTINGSYESHPNNPILTARNNPELALQKAGHADVVETQNGEWYMVHLCGRPITENKRCPLGRETAIQKVEWKEDWLYLSNGKNTPDEIVVSPNLPIYEFEIDPSRDDFDSDILNNNFQTLRIPLNEDILSLTERKGFLRLKGRESLTSKFTQATILRKWQSFTFEASTCVEFEPDNYQQMAGIVCLYDVENFYYLNITNDNGKKVLNLITCNNLNFEQPLQSPVNITGSKICYLKVIVNYNDLQFYYSLDNLKWCKIGDTLEASKLSDEYCKSSNFTGSFVGLCCQDLSGLKKQADFDYFEYIEFN